MKNSQSLVFYSYTVCKGTCTSLTIQILLRGWVEINEDPKAGIHHLNHTLPFSGTAQHTIILYGEGLGGLSCKAT